MEIGIALAVGYLIGWVVFGLCRHPMIRVRVGDVEVSATNEYTVVALLEQATSAAIAKDAQPQ